MSAPWEDTDFARIDTHLNPHVVQWVNNRGQLEPRKRKGGWFVPGTFGGEPLHLGGDPYAVTFYPNANDPVKGYYYDAVIIAPLALRFMWIEDVDRGWTQVLGLTQHRELVCLTGKGLTSRAYNRAVKAHKTWAAQVTDGKAPGWAFWMTLRAGEVQQFDQGGIVTHVEHMPAGEPQPAYIGAELVDFVNSIADAIRIWSLAWERGQDADDVRPHVHPEDAEEQGNTAPRPPAPAAAAHPGSHAPLSPVHDGKNGEQGESAHTRTQPTPELPVETLQLLLARAGRQGIKRFGVAVDVVLPADDPKRAASTLAETVPAASWWADVRTAAQLANAWMNKFHAAGQQDYTALDEVSERFRAEDTNPGHVAAVVALAWLVNPPFREKIEGWIDRWAITLTKKTS